LISIPSANFTPRIGSVVVVEASPALLGGRRSLCFARCRAFRRDPNNSCESTHVGAPPPTPSCHSHRSRAVNIVNHICEPSRANHFAFCQSARYGVLSANRSLQPFILCVRSSTSRLIRLSSASFFVSLPFSLSALLARANSPKVARTDLPIALARHELRIHEAAACTLSR